MITLSVGEEYRRRHLEKIGESSADDVIITKSSRRMISVKEPLAIRIDISISEEALDEAQERIILLDETPQQSIELVNPQIVTPEGNMEFDQDALLTLAREGGRVVIEYLVIFESPGRYLIPPAILVIGDRVVSSETYFIEVVQQSKVVEVPSPRIVNVTLPRTITRKQLKKTSSDERSPPREGGKGEEEVEVVVESKSVKYPHFELLTSVESGVVVELGRVKEKIHAQVINPLRSKSRPASVVFIGRNGSGKRTWIMYTARSALDAGISVYRMITPSERTDPVTLLDELKSLVQNLEGPAIIIAENADFLFTRGLSLTGDVELVQLWKEIFNGIDGKPLSITLSVENAELVSRSLIGGSYFYLIDLNKLPQTEEEALALLHHFIETHGAWIVPFEDEGRLAKMILENGLNAGDLESAVIRAMEFTHQMAVEGREPETEGRGLLDRIVGRGGKRKKKVEARPITEEVLMRFLVRSE